MVSAGSSQAFYLLLRGTNESQSRWFTRREHCFREWLLILAFQCQRRTDRQNQFQIVALVGAACHWFLVSLLACPGGSQGVNGTPMTVILFEAAMP